MRNDENAMEHRIGELELKLSLTEDHLQELDRALFRQQQQIDLLQGQLREMHRQMQSGPDQPGEVPNPRDEVPPHY